MCGKRSWLIERMLIFEGITANNHPWFISVMRYLLSLSLSLCLCACVCVCGSLGESPLLKGYRVIRVIKPDARGRMLATY